MLVILLVNKVGCVFYLHFTSVSACMSGAACHMQLSGAEDELKQRVR